MFDVEGLNTNKEFTLGSTYTSKKTTQYQQ